MAYVTRRQRAEQRKNKLRMILIVILITMVLCAVLITVNKVRNNTQTSNLVAADLSEIVPEPTGKDPYIEVNSNKPFFTKEEKTTDVFETYSDQDSLGRCGVAYANVCTELMPTEERGEIGQIKPTGWVQNKYPGIVQSTPPYLYNRCHLISFCLTGENANEKNLITGTRYMNVDGMLPFEEKVARYIDKTGNHVLYRVTPDYRDDNLLANGVLMEAYSVEDRGKGICFCVYCFNIQPGIEIDYRTGNNRKK